ncbi:MAG TPA: hypothetical protein VHS06_03935, partial [Chloroflexota bacterium]|nr:hypothetical protein [Chloroflexota bacterium]
KAITRVVFANQQLDGFWPKAGGYSTVGTIAEGYDHPLDLPGGQQADRGGRGDLSGRKRGAGGSAAG